jgi:hypothetical protein
MVPVDAAVARSDDARAMLPDPITAPASHGWPDVAQAGPPDR